jgi:hypothetical protein
MCKMYCIQFPASAVQSAVAVKNIYLDILHTLPFHNYEMRLSRIFPVIIQSLIVTYLITFTILFSQYKSGRVVT